MIICSFDPSSTRNLGFAIASLNGKEIDLKAGTFVLPNSEGIKHQMLWTVFQIIDLFLTENEPDLIVVEQTGSFSGGFITSQVSNCIGVILACCGKHNSEVKFVYPTHVKKVVTGKGKATKTIMKKKVNEHISKWGIESVKFDSEHACDATANIFCWLLEDLNSPLRENQNER